MSEFRIRASRLEDLAALPAIEAQAAGLFPPGLLPAGATGTLPATALEALHAAGLLWVADLEGREVAGFLAAQVHVDCLHVTEMDVSPAFGRQGLGTRLLAHAAHEARARGLAWLTLTTFEQVPWNAPFYARNGFVRAEDLAAFPHLQRALAHESELGLQGRIAMVRPLQP